MYSVQGIGAVVVSALCYSEVSGGAPVRYFVNNEVTPALSEQIFHGICLHNKKGAVTSVQIRGFVTVSYTGDDPMIGYERFIANAEGSVKVDTSDNVDNPLRLVVEVDTEEKKVTFMM